MVWSCETMKEERIPARMELTVVEEDSEEDLVEGGQME